MNEVEKLKKIADFGIPATILARECCCSAASIRNYISGASLPNGTKTVAIDDGLTNILNVIKAIVEE